MGLSELVGGPCVSIGIVLKEGGGWEKKQVGSHGRSFFFLIFPPFEKKSHDVDW